MATATPQPTLPLAELVRTHQVGIWRYLRYLGCGEAAADDLTQETFLAVLQKPFEQRSSRETFGYLQRVARNKFLASRRRDGRSEPLVDLDIADEVWSRLASDGGGQMLDALDDCVGQLQGKAAQAITLRYRLEKSRDAMAAELELSSDGVKTLLRRTRAALKQCIERKIETAPE